MLSETDLVPDRQTLIDVLNAYGHSADGECGEAKALWNDIENVFVKYDCIVVTTLTDCLSRRGHLNEAYDVIADFEANTERLYHCMWLALMSGCRKFGDPLLGHKVYHDMTNRFYPNHHCIQHAKLLLTQLKQNELNAVNEQILISS